MRRSVIFVFILGSFCFNGWEKQHQKMISVLRDYGIKDEKVLQVMKEIPRHEFVPEPYRSFAYEDTPLPIGYGQTISQPYIVALMTELLEVQSTDRVLEIGTGSGYQAAILGKLAKEVYTIEIVDELCQRSKLTLKKLNFTNVFVICGDGYQGYSEKAPFDKIMITAAPERVPPKLVEQLKENGIMVAPIGGRKEIQYLYKFYKKNQTLIENRLIPVRFVPMITKEELK
ncbi:MAG: protein-L-isoaspartate(D-aspartate) O-methyltransferase [Leptospiraceae bacterium]|nr:protein-L-isoaspartate(D-aspartate) O-methyltransferase [Leptospiraceae bacterium]MDW7976946.1 protein-L-isoaspartate(D-aspartate) O-methyltransferase [Leptospiraceae bacterium]